MNALFASRPAREVARRVLLALALLTLGTGCGRFHRGELDDGASYVIFVNQSLEQADVYAIPSSGEAIRIGTVMPGRTETLTVSSDLTVRSPVNIVARLLARSATPQSGPVSLRPGDRLQVTLPLDGRILTVLPAS